MKIPLTQGYAAIIDDEDYDLISGYKWHAAKKRNNVYAKSYILGSKNKNIWMHRLIVGATQPSESTDHINGNGIDNRRSNLRIVTTAQNNYNKKKQANTINRYKGVVSQRGFFYASIGHHGEKILIGLYKSEVEAADAYNKKAIELFGEYARLNEITNGEVVETHPRGQHKWTKNKTGYKGVGIVKDKYTTRYTASIVIDGHKKYLGCYVTPAEAGRAYNEAVKENHGEEYIVTVA